MHHPAGFDLAKLLGAVEPEAFFRDSWEKQPYFVARNDPAYYDGLFSRRDLDSVIAFTRPQFRDPESFNAGPQSRSNVVQGWLPDEQPFPGCYPDLAGARRAYDRGKTLLINSIQLRWPAVAVLSRNLEAFFGCPIHTYLLLTPPGAQGLAPHYDAYEVFVLQIDGEKHWRFYGVARELPLAGDQNEVPRDQLGPPTREVLLRPGDLLYVPRGHAHEAFTSERASLHLTIGVRVYRWLDLLQHALTTAGAADVRFRRSLPPGVLCAGACPPAVRDTVRDLLQLFAAGARADEALGAMAETFVSKLAALPHDYFASDDPDQINIDTVLELAPGVVCRVVRRGEGATLYAPGARIDGPAKVAPALQFIARSRRFTPRDLPDSLTAEARLVLVRRLVSEKLLTVAHNAGVS
jgi:ribosomal protein L16 Arg81 hydroxylase